MSNGAPLTRIRPEIITGVAAMQQRSLAECAAGRRIAFVPTMGYLHDGHLSLLRAAREVGDLVVLSIFVNPTQFGVGEDFDSYPRDLERDIELAAGVGTDVVFAPGAAEMYPRGYATFVEVQGLTDNLCGRSRPGHFRGVTTVVSKLFAIVQPHVALFGRKDFQQLAVIRRMSSDLNLPVEVRGMPIVREADGLAMSSRNVRLAPHERHQALSLYQGICRAVELIRAGERDAAAVIQAVSELIARQPQAQIDYVQICNAHTLVDQHSIDGDSVLLLAVRIGETRLIDNHHLGEEIVRR